MRYRIVRIGVRGDSQAPPRASRWSARPPSPRFRLSMLFLFRGGILFEIEWAENGARSGFLLRQEAAAPECETWCLCHCCLFAFMATGCHPRHPPRAFPLGLLAPRCLGAVLFLASAPCSALARAPLHLGGERNPPPSVGLLLAVVWGSIQCFSVDSGLRVSLPSFYVPSESALAQPPSSFSILLSWCRFRY